jgi:hypothetical protein
VLTVPYRVRYQMAWKHGLSRTVLGVYARVLLDVYAGRARERGMDRTFTIDVLACPHCGAGYD